MALDRSARIFLDAASLFAAAHSPRGGSAYIVRVCAEGYLQAVVSPDVLLEVERNLAAKSSAEALGRYHELVSSTPLQLVSAPPESVIDQYRSVFFEDAHVVAAALSARCRYVITLDNGLLSRVANSQLPFLCVIPKTFLQEILPNHQDYAEIRDALQN